MNTKRAQELFDMEYGSPRFRAIRAILVACKIQTSDVLIDLIKHLEERCIKLPSTDGIVYNQAIRDCIKICESLQILNQQKELK